MVGRTIDKVYVLHPRAVRRHLAGPADFACRAGGPPHRRGPPPRQVPVAPLVGEDALLAHLGMSGQLLVGDPDRPLSPHVRAVFTFTDGGPDLRFTDQRTFGHLLFVPDGAELPGPIAHIAPDPLEEAFDDTAFATALRRRHTGIKRALLDQSLISGVGNIYADEALWRAKLHYARATDTLTRPEVTGACWRGCARSCGPRWPRAAPRSTACTSTSTGRAATSTARWPSTAARVSRARAVAPRSAGTRS